jgi:hypothetical protein
MLLIKLKLGQVDMLLNVCVANYRDGEEIIKTALRDAWQRKKRLREGDLATQEASAGFW